MTYDPSTDTRLDPRARDALTRLPPDASGDVDSREQLLAEANSRRGLENRALWRRIFDAMDDERIVPRAGLRFADHTLTSSPDGNRINLQFIRPDTTEALPCVYYIHGGSMASLSCYDGMYRAWGRLLASMGAAVAMIDFRNSVSPSSVPEVAPYPAGLDDCASGLEWIHEHAPELGIVASCIVVSGDSGGGNLSLALGIRLNRDERLDLVSGLYVLAPYLAGIWPQERFPSTYENEGVFLSLHHNRGRMSYGIEAFEAGDPLAWPLFASDVDLRGLVPTVISVNECDPLRDEGIAFYRQLMRAGVPARCRQVMGTYHVNEVMTTVCPDISRDTARDIVAFAREGRHPLARSDQV